MVTSGVLHVHIWEAASLGTDRYGLCRGVSVGVLAAGANALGGLEFSFASFVVPITIFSGANWLFLETYGGQYWHVGLRWDF